jgi:hypothetical protein
MAETYEQYEKLKNRTKPTSWMTVEDKVDAALDQGELLRGVYARVAAFLESYEADVQPNLDVAAEIRERARVSAGKFSEQTADLMEADAQVVAEVRRVHHEHQRLFLDDLKVLLDQMPEGYRS